MPNKMSCPICHSDMRNRSLFSHYSLKAYRVCPDCQARYTVDAKSKKRRLVIAILGFLTIALSVAGITLGWPWGLAAFLSGTGCLVYAGLVLSKMEYVEYVD